MTEILQTLTFHEVVFVNDVPELDMYLGAVNLSNEWFDSQEWNDAYHGCPKYKQYMEEWN